MKIWGFIKAVIFPGILINSIGIFLYMYFVSPPVNWPVLILATIGFTITGFFSMKEAEKIVREKKENKG